MPLVESTILHTVVKHGNPDGVELPSYMVYLQKLNELGWPKDGPLYRIAMTLLGDKDNREPWLMILPGFAFDWVKTVRDKQGYKYVIVGLAIDV
ncbi:hypothetical protein Ccrd_004417 [Cynara cardunculus var. scolymus]|uniref:Uncharacterized protein n=1 Tax=Cynara cardunculus var. scolymus TaxID=59895 RepID=A0A103XMG3_CYNCS|nr:hypothetical protein Ccrd_004417 [Cynara cardunculus var. scolymus]